MAQLLSLECSHCQLTGQLPSDWGKLTQLQTVDLSHNQLNGSFVGVLGPQLQSLNVSNNNLSVTVDANVDIATSAPLLKVLNASNNFLTGALPNSKRHFDSSINLSVSCC